MSRARKNIAKSKKSPKKTGNESDDELIEMAAEQLAEILWKQIKYNHRKKKDDGRL